MITRLNQISLLLVTLAVIILALTVRVQLERIERLERVVVILAAREST